MTPRPIILVPNFDRIMPFLREHQTDFYEAIKKEGGESQDYLHFLSTHYRLPNTKTKSLSMPSLQLVNDILDNFYGSEHYFDIKDVFTPTTDINQHLRLTTTYWNG
jgi:hypothetical protein